MTNIPFNIGALVCNDFRTSSFSIQATNKTTTWTPTPSKAENNRYLLFLFSAWYNNRIHNTDSFIPNMYPTV